jgi:type IV pilus assembly PilO-like protein
MSKSIKTLLVGVVAVAAIAAYWMLVLSPKRKEATDLSSKIAAQQAQVAQNQSLLANFEKAKQDYRKNYTTLVRLGKAIPADDDVHSLVVQLDAAAKRSGVDFQNIDIGQGGGTASALPSTATTNGATGSVPPGAVSAGAFSAMPFAFSFAGDYNGLSKFFARLERFVGIKGDKIDVNGRLLRIESISLTPDEGGWPGLHAQIGASSYIVPLAQDPAAQGSAGGTTPGTTTPGTSTSTSTSPSGSSSSGTESTGSASMTAPTNPAQ